MIDSITDDIHNDVEKETLLHHKHHHTHHHHHHPPPLAIGVLASVFLTCVASLPSFDQIDEIATIETYTRTIFPDHIVASPIYLGWLRIFFSVVIFGTSLWIYLGEGWLHQTGYFSESKLNPCLVTMKGLRTQFVFTSWAWNLLGFSFLLAGTISLLVSYGYGDALATRQRWILRLATISFEIAAPASMLVSSIVKFVIWPKLLSDGGSKRTEGYRKLTALLQHDANAIMVLLEIGILGGLPVEISHISFAPLLGVTYVVFSWTMAKVWAPEHGPQFLYHFLDTTLGHVTTLALIYLLMVLLVFYALFWAINNISGTDVGGPIVHSVGIISLSTLVCRFRD